MTDRNASGAPDSSTDVAGKARMCERLARGEMLFVLGIRNARTADIARMARTAGYAGIWIDLEHSGMTLDCAVQIAAAAEDLGLEAWARVPEREYGMIGRLLDGGVTGIIAPRVETLEQARDVVEAARFPPRGHRSFIASLPQFGFRRLQSAELMQASDRCTAVQILLESERGVANADAIAALDGVDMVAVGMNDLAADIASRAKTGRAALEEACAQVAQAARRHGKLAVVGGAADPIQCARLIALGIAPLIFAGIDTDVLAAGLTQRVAEWRGGLTGIRNE